MIQTFPAQSKKIKHHGCERSRQSLGKVKGANHYGYEWSRQSLDGERVKSLWVRMNPDIPWTEWKGQTITDDPDTPWAEWTRGWVGSCSWAHYYMIFIEFQPKYSLFKRNFPKTDAILVPKCQFLGFFLNNISLAKDFGRKTYPWLRNFCQKYTLG